MNIKEKMELIELIDKTDDIITIDEVNINELIESVDTYDITEDEVYRSKNLKTSSQSSCNSAGAFAAGTVYSNISNASSLYFDNKILTLRGHGFAAEHANHMADLYQGKNAKIVGDDNAKNGADRIVNGVNIQSKYCASGSECIQKCFKDGQFRYWNTDGSPMQIEVPSDMYESAK